MGNKKKESKRERLTNQIQSRMNEICSIQRVQQPPYTCLLEIGLRRSGRSGDTIMGFKGFLKRFQFIGSVPLVASFLALTHLGSHQRLV